MNLMEHVKEFTQVEDGQPEKNGCYEVVVRTQSRWNGGIFLTLMDFRDGRWVPKDGYCELRVMAWAEKL